MKVAVADGGARGARSPPPIILDQTEKMFFGAPPPTLSKGLGDHSPPRLISRFGSGTELSEVMLVHPRSSPWCGLLSQINIRVRRHS